VRRIRFVALAAGVAALTMAAAGCSGKQAGTGSLGTVTATTTPAAPSGAGTGTPPGAPTGGATSGGGGGGGGATSKPPAPPAFPTSAKSYGQEMLDNLFGGDSDRVIQLVDDQAMFTLQSTRFPDDHHYHFYSCGPFSVGQTRCFYDNDEGDRMSLTFASALIGKAHAIHGIDVDPTRYQADAAAMAQDFFDAWTNGNTARMKALSVDGFTESWLQLHPSTPPKITTAVSSADSTSTYTAVNAVGSDSSIYEVVVTVALLGQPHAIMAKPA